MLHTHSLASRRRLGLSTFTLSLISLLAIFVTSVAADKTAADYFIHSLPGAPDGPLLKQHAGHIEVNPEHNGNIFFWLNHNRHIADRPRTVIWLNGGPGCSSMDGAMMEVGPYRVQKEGKLTYLDGSWDEFANILFVDQPVGTGFSYVDTDSYLHELDEMADQFLIFLEKFFALFPDFETDDLYFAGESYAGQYIPYIAKAILDRNSNNKNSINKQWNLKGLLIGNGWIAPIEQYQAYLPFAYEEGLVQGGTVQATTVEKTLSDCLKELSKPEADQKINIYQCENILTSILTVSAKDNKCYNMYDVRLTDVSPSCGMNWPPDLETVTPYLRRDDVISALHINPEKRTGWSECSGSVGSNFRAANSVPSVKLLPEIIESGVPILLFSGAKDLICNHKGTEDFISNMKWNDGQGFETSSGVYAPKRDWTFEGEPAGIWQEARNLTYVLFYNASHMVPFDWPRRTRDMLDRFMGIDIASIGGQPADSRIDGEKSHSETSVGGHSNSTAAIEDQKQKLHQAALKAYYRSGEAALVVVVIGAAAFGFWVWRGRRGNRVDTKGLGSYASIPGIGERFRDSVGGHLGMNGNSGAKGRKDVEAGDFDESELETLPASRAHGLSNTDTRDLAVESGHMYDLASDSEDDDDEDSQQGRGKERG